MSERISGLSDDHAAHARSLIVKAAKIMARNRSIIHYSQGADRNQGIREKLTITRNQYPRRGDCSSTSYWMLWDALHRPYGVRDLVGNANWSSCYTGSMYKHGKGVHHAENLKIGDLIFYGDQGGGIPEHVAVYIGGWKVFSHGSESGPYISGIDYRGDRRMSRRYI